MRMKQSRTFQMSLNETFGEDTSVDHRETTEECARKWSRETARRKVARGSGSATGKRCSWGKERTKKEGARDREQERGRPKRRKELRKGSAAEEEKTGKIDKVKEKGNVKQEKGKRRQRGRRKSQAEESRRKERRKIYKRTCCMVYRAAGVTARQRQ